MIKFGYNPFAIGTEDYDDVEKRRSAAGQKKSKQQVEDEKRYEGDLGKYWEHQEKWKKEQAKREEREKNGKSRKEYYQKWYQNKKNGGKK